MLALGFSQRLRLKVHIISNSGLLLRRCAIYMNKREKKKKSMNFNNIVF